MNFTRFIVVALLLVLLVLTVGLAVNQWRLQRAVEPLLRGGTVSAVLPEKVGNVDGALNDAERRIAETKAELERTEARLAAANTQIAQLDQRLRQLEGGRMPRTRTPGVAFQPAEIPQGLEGGVTNTNKRGWGPEQAAGPPDTMQAGDISTAWASANPDGGEEWLKLEYERAVDIAEVRVRETYNPGAITKVTAFLGDGRELTLWEGTEPPSQAPVEMSFQVPSTVVAKSVKVYLDTTLVPGWNEIDAVAIVARDGSIQWAQHVKASSTYALRGGGVNRELGFETRF
jgi:hypothetical protein